MINLKSRLHSLELKGKSKADPYTIWRIQGESEEQARQRAGVPDDAEQVVIISWLSGELPAEKHGNTLR